MARTTHNLATALDQARQYAASTSSTVYVVPTVYGFSYAYTRDTIGAPKWIEVEPDGSAVAVMTEWQNSGKIESRAPIA